MISPWPIFSKPLTQEEFESRKGTHLGIAMADSRL